MKQKFFQNKVSLLLETNCNKEKKKHKTHCRRHWWKLIYDYKSTNDDTGNNGDPFSYAAGSVWWCSDV